MGKKAKEETGSERRRDPRHERTVPLLVGGDTAEGLRAESINVSTRGLYCKVPRYIQPFSTHNSYMCGQLSLFAVMNRLIRSLFFSMVRSWSG